MAGRHDGLAARQLRAPSKDRRGPVGTLAEVGYPRGLLHEDEELLAEVRPHPVVVVGPVLLFLVALGGAVTIALRYPGAPVVVAWLLAAMVALPALWATARVLRWRAVRFLVTTSRLLYRRGVLGRDVVQLRLQRVAEVRCSQSLAARLIGTGRLVFEVAGGDGPLVVEDVRWPRRLLRLINAQLDRLEVSYGGYAGHGGYSGYAGSPGYAGYAGYAGSPGYDGYDGYDRGRPAPTSVHSPAVARGELAAEGASGRRRPREGRGRSWTDTPPHGVVLDDDEPAQTVPRQILQLDELRRRGILSEDEFAAKKAELLGRL